MTTVKQIFEIAMALADSQIDGKGIAEENEEYQTRTPMILNVLQTELASKGKLKIVIDAQIDKENEWKEIQLPDDLDRISKIVLLTEDGTYVKGCFKYIVENQGNGNVLRVNSALKGTLKIEYQQIPEMISSINDIVTVSDSVARCVLPYGLVANLFIEENPTVASFCQQKYEENKENANSILAPIELEYVAESYGDIYDGNY